MQKTKKTTALLLGASLLLSVPALPVLAEGDYNPYVGGNTNLQVQYNGFNPYNPTNNGGDESTRYTNYPSSDWNNNGTGYIPNYPSFDGGIPYNPSYDFSDRGTGYIPYYPPFDGGIPYDPSYDFSDRGTGYIPYYPFDGCTPYNPYDFSDQGTGYIPYYPDDRSGCIVYPTCEPQRSYTRNVCANQDFSITLDTNPSTGYSWSYTASPSRCLRLMGAYTTASSNMPGAPEKMNYTFRARRRGTYTLTFKYGRGSSTVKTVTYTVYVR